MEVAGSKAQTGAGIQALLQTDLNTSKLHGAITENGKDRQTAWPAIARGLRKHGEGWAGEGLAPRQTQHLCLFLD